MKFRFLKKIILILSSAYLLLIFSCSTLPQGVESVDFGKIIPSADFFPVWNQIAAGLEVLSYSTDYPRFHISAVRIDLSVPEREIIISPGLKPVDETTPGGMNFLAKRVGQYIRSENLLAAINVTPFGEYRLFPGLKQSAVGIVVSDGNIYSWNEKYDALIVTKDRRVIFRSPPFSLSASISDAAGGFFIILSNSRNVAWDSPRDARSLAGTTKGGRVLILAAIDGPHTQSGSGATFFESSEWLSALGADNGILLDGGGSSVLAIRDSEEEQVAILNNPDGGFSAFFQRNVPVFLGVR